MIGSTEFRTSVALRLASFFSVILHITTTTPKWISKPCHQYHDLSQVTGYHQLSLPCYSISIPGGKYLDRHHRHLPVTNCQGVKSQWLALPTSLDIIDVFIVAFQSLRVFLSSSSDQFSDNSPALTTGATILMSHQQWRTNLQGQIQVRSTLFHHWHS